MYKQEQIKPYEGEGEKGKLVEEMFDNIAPTYDTLNHRLSWDIDKGWRRKAIRLLQRHYPERCSTSLPAPATSPFWRPKCCIPNSSSEQTYPRA